MGKLYVQRSVMTEEQSQAPLTNSSSFREMLASIFSCCSRHFQCKRSLWGDNQGRRKFPELFVPFLLL